MVRLQRMALLAQPQPGRELLLQPGQLGLELESLSGRPGWSQQSWFHQRVRRQGAEQGRPGQWQVRLERGHTGQVVTDMPLPDLGRVRATGQGFREEAKLIQPHIVGAEARGEHHVYATEVQKLLA